MRLQFLILLVFSALLPLEADDRPNFVLIFIDDMGYGDIESFGSTVNSTPNLNKMAAEGMKLTSFYAAPVCSASRAQLLTGCYAPRVSVPGVFFPRQSEGLNPDEHTIADYLKAAGYATACVGKWHLGDQVEFLPTRQGFDSYFGIPYSNDMQRTATESGLRVTPLLRDEKVADLLEDEAQRRVTREYTEESVKYIKSKAESDQPFFLYMAHTAMHIPIYPHQDFVGTSNNGVYGDWVAEVDWSVGEILKALDSADLSKDTLVIFTSDNGPWASKGDKGGVSGVLRGSKGGTMEGGVRVPTIARWIDRIKPGTTSDAITGTTDMLPTFATLAGVDLKQDRKIDGVNITDVLDGKSEQSSREAWYYFGGSTLQAVRQGPWKLAVAKQRIGMGFKENPEDLNKMGRLYNLDNEIGEITDVSEQHPEIVAKLTKLAQAKDEELKANQRPVGRVENPVMLYPSDTPVRGKKTTGASKLKDWGLVKSGDVYSTDSVPEIAKKAFTITTQIKGKKSQGVILAHGGSSVGYSLYIDAGKVVFAISQGGGSIDRVSLPVTDHDLPYIASMKQDEITLSQGERSQSSPSGWVKSHPKEDLSIGHDDKNAVDPKSPTGKFKGGKIENVRVEVH